MALDIWRGDRIVIDEIEYVIVGVGRWKITPTPSVLTLMRVRARTKRIIYNAQGNPISTFAPHADIPCSPVCWIEDGLAADAVAKPECLIADTTDFSVIHLDLEEIPHHADNKEERR